MRALGTLGSIALVVTCLGCSRSALSIAGAGARGGDGALVGAAGRGSAPASCREIAIEEQVEVVEEPGSVLFVFDRSGSMAEPWTRAPRWQVAGGAITDALRSASPALTVGAIFFPSRNGMQACVDPTGITCMFVPGLVVDTGSCLVAPMDSPEQIAFAPAPEFLDAFEASSMLSDEPRYAPLTGGLTPLREALAVAADALHAGTRPGITSVVVVTHGEPNCEWDQYVATQMLDGLREIGIATYVLGLPGVGSDATSVLGELASRGGTRTFVTPENADTLERHFRDIIEDTASAGLESCTVPLDPALPDPSDVRLLVGDGADARELAALDERGERAYRVTPDGRTLQLRGTTCTQALEGAFDHLRLEAGCGLPR